MDLTTKYLGFDLKNPLVPSASPLSKSVEQAKELEDHGASALIMYSLFEEAITAETETINRFLNQQDTGFAEADDGFLPDWQDFSTGLDQYLDNVRRLKEALDIPIIASLNGVTPSGWVSNGKLLEEAGADGVSLFNRFYQPDINIDSLRLQPSLHPSTSAEALLAMRWIAILYGRIDRLSLGATSGIHTAEDAIKLLLAGADVVHLCSTLLKNGPQQVTRIEKGLVQWMEEQSFESLADVRGRVSALSIPNPADFERANYVNIIDSYSFAPGVMV
jgi:dihydroorotate dehydrogenase